MSSTSRIFPESVSQVASLKSIPGEESLVIVTREGDIASMKLDDPEPQVRLILPAHWRVHVVSSK